MPSLTDYLGLKTATPEERASRIRTFAAKISVDVVTVRRYILGRRRPDWDVIARIIKATKGQVTADDFLSERSVKKRTRPREAHAA